MPPPEARPRMSLMLNIHAEYHQFYLQDEQTKIDPPTDWGKQLTTDWIAADPGVVGVATARNMPVPVRIDLFDTQPSNDFGSWDHVAEASLDIPSGQIVIAGGIDYFPDSTRLTVTPGNYRVRVYYGGLDTLSEDGLEGNDQYYVAIWPDTYSTTTILKRWLTL